MDTAVVADHATSATDVRSLVPPLRHVAWAVATLLAVALTGWVSTDSQRLRTDLAHHGARLAVAHRIHNQLQIELETRRRSVYLEAAAGRLGMVATVPVHRIEAP